MSGDLVKRLFRRAVVLGATLAVIGVGVATVKVAADWRAAAAPLDTAPSGMSTINAQFVAETNRAGGLKDQANAVAGQIADLQAAVAQAGEHVAGDTQSAASLKADLEAAKQKLATLQAQLKAAQDRLAALNKAAARQAAANAAPGTAPSGGGEPHDDD